MPPPSTPSPSSPLAEFWGTLGPLLCFSDFCLETEAQGLSASDLLTTASTWHLTVLTQFLRPGTAPPQAQLWREKGPHCFGPGWPCGRRCRRWGLRADTSVALTGRDRQSGGCLPWRGRERCSGLHPNSLCFVGRSHLDINLFLHMFPFSFFVHSPADIITFEVS